MGSVHLISGVVWTCDIGNWHVCVLSALGHVNQLAGGALWAEGCPPIHQPTIRKQAQPAQTPPRAGQDATRAWQRHIRGGPNGIARGSVLRPREWPWIFGDNVNPASHLPHPNVAAKTPRRSHGGLGGRSEIATLNRPFSRGRGAAASTLNGFARQ